MENLSWDAIPIIFVCMILGIGILIGSFFKKKK